MDSDHFPLTMTIRVKLKAPPPATRTIRIKYDKCTAEQRIDFNKKLKTVVDRNIDTPLESIPTPFWVEAGEIAKDTLPIIEAKKNRYPVSENVLALAEARDEALQPSG